MSDRELLQQYVQSGSEEAFAELVRRHIHWVHSSAMRQVRDRHLAEDVAQTVFIVLAQKARTLKEEVVLAGWLFKVTRYAASEVLRGERRRKIREHKAATMLYSKSKPDDQWEQLAPA